MTSNNFEFNFLAFCFSGFSSAFWLSLTTLHKFSQQNIYKQIILQMASRRHNSSSHNYSQAACHGLQNRHIGRNMRSRTRKMPRNRSEINFCVKYTVFGFDFLAFGLGVLSIVRFNVLFWVLGFLLLGIGVWSRLEKNNLYSQLALFYLDPAWLLIIIGSIIFCIGFSGCIGALRENTCFLAVYSSILGLLLLTEALVVVLAFFAKDFIENDLNNRLDHMIISYRDDPDLQTIIDWVQQDFNCCGIHNPDDWDKNIYFNSNSKSVMGRPFNNIEAGGVPFSCCKDLDKALPNFACGQGTRVSTQTLKLSYHNNIFTEGCLPKMQSWLNNNFLYVGAAIFVVAIIQFLGICFAQDLRSDIFAQRAKWSRRA